MTLYSSVVRDFHNFQIVWGKQIISPLLMMENSMVVIKLLKIASNYLPNEMIFMLQSEK